MHDPILPPPPELERRWIALATLDALLSPEWEYRHWSYDPAWDRERGTRMGSMRDGSGDEVFALFFPDGTVALKGFAHESPARRGPGVPGVLDGLPARFAAFSEEPAFSMAYTTFCAWNEGDGWRRSASVAPADLARDVSAELLAPLVGPPVAYATFAEEVFERSVSLDAIARFFAHEPLSVALATALHPDVDLDAVPDLADIGYPGAAR